MLTRLLNRASPAVALTARRFVHKGNEMGPPKVYHSFLQSMAGYTVLTVAALSVPMWVMTHLDDYRPKVVPELNPEVVEKYGIPAKYGHH